jgi:hypothetical protein
MNQRDQRDQHDQTYMEINADIIYALFQQCLSSPLLTTVTSCDYIGKRTRRRLAAIRAGRPRRSKKKSPNPYHEYISGTSL